MWAINRLNVVVSARRWKQSRKFLRPGTAPQGDSPIVFLITLHTQFISELCVLSSHLNHGQLKKKWTNRSQEQSWSFLNLKERNVLGAHMSFHYKTDYLLLHQTPQQSWIMTFESSNPFPHPHPCTCRDKEILWVIKAGAKCTTGNSWCRTWSHFPWREQLRTG